MSGSKLGKGGGRGTGRMVVAPPPPLGRGMAMPMRRQVMGPKQKETGMGRLGSAGGSGLAFVAPSQEESFQVLSLDQGRAPFAMAIRLTPEVLEDLKRAEAEDVKCEMKFGITPSGHVRLSFAMPFIVSEYAIFRIAGCYGRQERSTVAFFPRPLPDPLPVLSPQLSLSFALFVDAQLAAPDTFFSKCFCNGISFGS